MRLLSTDRFEGAIVTNTAQVVGAIAAIHDILTEPRTRLRQLQCGTAAQLPKRRSRKQHKSHERRNRVTWQPEDQGVAQSPEHERLPWFHSHSPQLQRSPELLQCWLNEILHSDRDAARHDNHIVASGSLE